MVMYRTKNLCPLVVQTVKKREFMTKTPYFEIATKPSLFPGKGAFLRNLFLRNKANLSNQKFTANPYAMEGYNDSRPKPKNGTNPNKANLKPILKNKKICEIPRNPRIKKLQNEPNLRGT